jgi:CubicO group peptidase (beta-lactamase class C family)
VPARLDALFRIHSMTKPITSVAALMLMDEGRLRADDPVSTYLSAYRSPRVLTGMSADGSVLTRPALAPITIRHLLTHTSGIGYGFSDPLLLQLTTRSGKPEIELPLLHDPGARWTYGASTRVLGDVIERVTGGSLDAFFASRIFEPLGMRDTFFRVPDDKRARVISRYQRGGGRLSEEALSTVEEQPVRGDGGLYSTARDYATFMQMLLNDGRAGGRRLLSARSMQLLRTNQIGALKVDLQPAADAARTRPFPIGAGRDTFGFGFQLAAPSTTGRAGRRPGSMSWGGLRNTHFWIDPRAGIGAVFMTQVLPFHDHEVMAVLATFEETVYRGD